jgi:hypothetical protein
MPSDNRTLLRLGAAFSSNTIRRERKRATSEDLPEIDSALANNDERS